MFLLLMQMFLLMLPGCSVSPGGRFLPEVMPRQTSAASTATIVPITIHMTADPCTSRHTPCSLTPLHRAATPESSQRRRRAAPSALGPWP